MRARQDIDDAVSACHGQPRKRRELCDRYFDSTVWNDFRFRPGDVVIASYAKAGTTWLRQIVAQLIFGGRDIVWSLHNHHANHNEEACRLLNDLPASFRPAGRPAAGLRRPVLQGMACRRRPSDLALLGPRALLVAHPSPAEGAPLPLRAHEGQCRPLRASERPNLAGPKSALARPAPAGSRRAPLQTEREDIP